MAPLVSSKPLAQASGVELVALLYALRVLCRRQRLTMRAAEEGRLLHVYSREVEDSIADAGDSAIHQDACPKPGSPRGSPGAT